MILDECKFESKLLEYELFSARNRVEQVAFAKKKVYDFLRADITPEHIALITPDESFATLLKSFDEENNFNFAMGFPFAKSLSFKKIEAVFEYLKEKNYENLYRLKRVDIQPDIVQKIEENFGKPTNTLETFEILKSFIPSDVREREIFEQELYLFEKLCDELKNYPLRDKIHLFLSRLKSRTIDDTRGGKITVMGVLESRACEFDAVIVVDFNEDIVPKRSPKDLFLSTALRKRAKLPTRTDRENLQKSYYHKLFKRSRYLAISFVEDELNQPSRFLDELIIEQKRFLANGLESILFAPSKQKRHYQQKDLFLEYDFSKTVLSSTKLKTYLECKRKYYFKYIKMIKEAKIPKEEEDEKIVGSLLHEALKDVFNFKHSVFSERELLDLLKNRLYEKTKEGSLLRLKVDIWLKKLTKFAQNEISRFKKGYRVIAVEKEMFGSFEGFRIKGNIDRIDEKEDKLSVIDYKSGKINFLTQKSIEKAVDFQLEFYYLLVSQKNEVENLYYYDLKEGILEEERFFEQKLKLLQEKLKLLRDKKQNFTMTDEIKNCKYCAYATICAREF